MTGFFETLRSFCSKYSCADNRHQAIVVAMYQQERWCVLFYIGNRCFLAWSIKKLAVKSDYSINRARFETNHSCRVISGRPPADHDKAEFAAIFSAMCLGPGNNLSDVIYLIIETGIWLQAIVCAYAYPAVLRKVVQHWQSIVIFPAC